MQVIGTGRQIDIAVLIVSNTTDTQISFTTRQTHNEILIHERTTNGLQLRTSPGDSDYWTIPSGSVLDLSSMGNPDGSYPLYLRAATATSTVELIGAFGE